MEREHWLQLSAAISQVQHRWPAYPRDQHTTATVVRVFLWAVIHQAAVSWACRSENWQPELRPRHLPDQSTMSRRIRRADFQRFFQRLSENLRGRRTSLLLVKRLDAKPLPIPAHSTDPHAGWGRGAGQKSKGYKLHMITADRPFPEQFRIAPLNVSEQEMARRMTRDLHGAGYIVADKNFDTNRLFDTAASRHHQLIAPRRHGAGRGLGHHRHSPHRLRCKDLLEDWAPRQNGFATALLEHRRTVERDFAHLVAFTGGLLVLPPWVRTYHRVRLWVWAKLLINAARIRCLQRRRGVGA